MEAQLARLRRQWASYWPDADTAAMVADVRARLAAAVDAWGLSDLAPLAGGDVALVVATADAVLKLNPRGHDEEPQIGGEAAALGFWSPSGVVPRVLRVRDDGFTLLMERCAPGVALDETELPFTERLRILGGLVAGLHAAGPPPSRFIHLRDHIAVWRAMQRPDAPLLAELTRPSSDDVLLHHDLHGGNALRHGDGWLVIDPKAVRGDRHADGWALLDPLVPALPPDPEEAAATARSWVETYAAAAQLDPARLALWTRVRARAEALEIASPDWAARLHAMADALRE